MGIEKDITTVRSYIDDIESHISSLQSENESLKDEVENLEQATRFSDPGLYGWDCESILVMNPHCVKEYSYR